MSRVIDVHNHVLTPAVEELVEQHYSREEITAREPYALYTGEASAAHNRTVGPTLRVKMTDPARRLADMDRTGVDVQILSTYVSQFYYWTDGELGQRVARLQNETLAGLVAAHPDRFAAIGTVPMQDSARAVAELEHVTQTLGFKGIQISSNIAGLDLDDPRFRPVLTRASELGAVVQIHPNGFDQGRRLDDFYLINVLGNPWDSTIALTRLIFSGVLAELPDLKLVVVHGGGFTPFYPARMDHAFHVRPECRKHIDRPPSSYLKQVYFDTMVFTPELIRTLVDFAGADHVMLGTDYPFDMGEEDPLGLTGAVPGLDAAALSGIRGGNAARLYGLGE